MTTKHGLSIICGFNVKRRVLTKADSSHTVGEMLHIVTYSLHAQLLCAANV